MYVDGVEIATESIGGLLDNWDPNFAFALGAELSSERPFLGLYDLVAIYDAALSPNEVQQNFDLGPQPAPPPPIPVCDGLTVTVDLTAGDSPTDGDDVILGTNGPDAILAGDGNDTICGEGGDDIITAGAGDDTVFGGDGADTISGQTGIDTLHGDCLLYTSPSPRDRTRSRMPSSA